MTIEVMGMENCVLMYIDTEEKLFKVKRSKQRRYRNVGGKSGERDVVELKREESVNKF